MRSRPERHLIIASELGRTGSLNLYLQLTYVCEGVAVGISIAGGLAVLVRLGSLGVGVGANVGVVAGVYIVSALRTRLLGGRSDVVVGNFARCECCGIGRVDISIATRNQDLELVSPLSEVVKIISGASTSPVYTLVND